MHFSFLLAFLIALCSVAAQQTARPPALDTNIALYDLITSAGVNLENVPASITSQLGKLHPFATDYPQQLSSFANGLPPDQRAEFEQGISVGQSLASQALLAAATQGNAPDALSAGSAAIVTGADGVEDTSSPGENSGASSMRLDYVLAGWIIGMSMIWGLIISC